MASFDWQKYFLKVADKTPAFSIFDSPEEVAAAFSIFDSPEEVAEKLKKTPKTTPESKPTEAPQESPKPSEPKEEKAPKPPKAPKKSPKPSAPKKTPPAQPESPEGSKWDEFLETFYEGGKKKVKNPNKDTKDSYPEVQVSTALKDSVFADKLKKEFEAWLAKGSEPESAKKPPEPEKVEPPKPKAPLKVGDKVTSLEDLKPGMFVGNKHGVYGQIKTVSPDAITYQTYNFATGEWSSPTYSYPVGDVDHYVSKHEFTVTQSPEKLVPEGAKVSPLSNIGVGDYVWTGGWPQRVEKIEPDPDAYGIRFKLQNGEWFNQKELDRPPSFSNGSHIFHKEGEKPVPKAQVGDAVTKPEQLEVGDWVEWPDEDSDDDDKYIGKVVEVTSEGVWLQDYLPNSAKLSPGKWLLVRKEMLQPEGKKIDPPKKIKQNLSGTEIKSPKKLKEHDVLRIYDYETGKKFTAQVSILQNGYVGLKVVSAKTGKVHRTLVIPPSKFEEFQIHRLPKSQISKALQPSESSDGHDSWKLKLEGEIAKLMAKGEVKKAPKEPKKQPQGDIKSIHDAKVGDALTWKIDGKEFHAIVDKSDPDSGLFYAMAVDSEGRPHKYFAFDSDDISELKVDRVNKELMPALKAAVVPPQPEAPKHAEAPKMASGVPLRDPADAKVGDTVSWTFHGNGKPYRGEVLSHDANGNIVLKVTWPSNSANFGKTLDPFDPALLEKNNAHLLSKEAEEEFAKATKEHEEQVAKANAEYQKKLKEWQQAKDLAAGVYSNVEHASTRKSFREINAPDHWNPNSRIAREADRLVPIYEEKYGADFREYLSHANASEKAPARFGSQTLWAKMSEEEKRFWNLSHNSDKLYPINKLFQQSLSSSEWGELQGCLSSWQGSSGGCGAHKLMGALEELGLLGAPMKGEDSEYCRTQGRTDKTLKSAVAKAIAFNEAFFKSVGIKDILVFRGMTSEALSYAETGASVQIPNARELSSASVDPETAYGFGSRQLAVKVPVSQVPFNPLIWINLCCYSGSEKAEFLLTDLAGLTVKAMPKSRYDFEGSVEKLHLGARKKTYVVSETVQSADWMRQPDGAYEKESLDERKKKAVRLLLGKAREDVSFRRSLLASLKYRTAAFSIFDSPEEIVKHYQEKPKAPSVPEENTPNSEPSSQEQTSSGATFEEWFAKRFEGGKKKVLNPNVKTRKKYPEVAASTAMKNQQFAAKVYAEYQQEAQKETSGDTSPESSKEEAADVRTRVVDGLLADWVNTDNPLDTLDSSLRKELGEEFSDEQKLEALKDVRSYLRDAVEEWSQDSENHQESDLWSSHLKEVQQAIHKLEGVDSKHLNFDSEDFKQVGPRTGSNPGGLYEGSDGTQYYVKTPQTEDHARNEILAGKLYALAGIDVPELSPATRDGKFSVASKIIPGLKRDRKKLTSGSSVPGVAEGIAVDAWLANWDVVGLEHDNLLVDKEGKAQRVDTGGALRYRAMGSPKGNAFGPTISELRHFRDPDTQSGSVFRHVSAGEIVDSIDRVLAIPEQKIRSLVHKWGPKDDKERDKLLETLLARREDLKKQREVFASKSGKASQEKQAMSKKQPEAPEKPDFIVSETPESADWIKNIPSERGKQKQTRAPKNVSDWDGKKHPRDEDGKFSKKAFNPTTYALLRLAKEHSDFRSALATQLRAVAPRDFAIEQGAQEAMLQGLQEGDVLRLKFKSDSTAPGEDVEVVVKLPYDPGTQVVPVEKSNGKEGLLVSGEGGVRYQGSAKATGLLVEKMTLVRSRV